MRPYRRVVSRASKVFFVSAAATVLLSACARPPSATVNEGADPFNVDKDVVFRTTYYFRVFDYCVARKLKNQKFDEVVVPLTDSLYRFRMTGKAGSNVSDVKFESGTLMAWEIDPFGAKVEYDPESRVDGYVKARSSPPEPNPLLSRPRFDLPLFPLRIDGADHRARSPRGKRDVVQGLE